MAKRARQAWLKQTSSAGAGEGTRVMSLHFNLEFLALWPMRFMRVQNA
jgi:hypothetical protein